MPQSGPPRSQLPALVSALLVAAAGTSTLSALPAHAHAQPPADAAEPDPDARAAFESAREAYSAGRYEDALRDFRRAYELSRRSLLLYNIGAAAERLARDEEAIEAYRAFVAAEPEHPSRAEAQRRIEVLEAHLRARGDAPADGGTTSDPVEPGDGEAPTTRQGGGWLFSWIALGATALSAGGAGLAWALANDAYASLESTCSATGCSDAQIAASDVQARIDATNAMWVVTGVLGAVTIALFLIEAPWDGGGGEGEGGEPAPATASLGVGPARLELRGTF